MSAIKYFDFSGKVLEEKEIEKHMEYHKAQVGDNGLFKIIETFENGKIDYVNVFIEEKTQVDYYLNKYPNLNNIEFCLFEERKGNFAKYQSFTLNKHHLKIDSAILVFGDGMLPIYVHRGLNNEPRYKYLFKYYYYPELNVEFEFEYEPSGDFKRLSIYDVNMIVDSDDCTIYPETVGVGKNDFDFNWQGLEYYKKAEPDLPNGEITTHNNVYSP